MILTHGANSLDRCVEIGGRRYKAVKIGNQLWMAENLDYKWTGLTIGGSYDTYENPHAWYYDNDEATYGIDGTYKCGLLYNWYAANQLEQNKSTLLPDGWHVPSKTEMDSLKTYLADSVNDGNKLKATPNSVVQGFPNSNWEGTDDYGFSALPVGVDTKGSFNYFNQYTIYWSSTTKSDDNGIAHSMYLWYEYSYLVIANDGKGRGVSIRLVKDAT